MSLKKNYVVGDLIGSGSMATIHRRVQKSLDRVVAIKKILPHLASSAAMSMSSSRASRARRATTAGSAGMVQDGTSR